MLTSKPFIKGKMIHSPLQGWLLFPRSEVSIWEYDPMDYVDIYGFL